MEKQTAEGQKSNELEQMRQRVNSVLSVYEKDRKNGLKEKDLEEIAILLGVPETILKNPQGRIIFKNLCRMVAMGRNLEVIETVTGKYVLASEGIKDKYTQNSLDVRNDILILTMLKEGDAKRIELSTDESGYLYADYIEMINQETKQYTKCYDELGLLYREIEYHPNSERMQKNIRRNIGTNFFEIVTITYDENENIVDTKGDQADYDSPYTLKTLEGPKVGPVQYLKELAEAIAKQKADWQKDAITKRFWEAKARRVNGGYR